jgi:hypothetical protein
VYRIRYNISILFYKGDEIMKKLLTLLLAVITMFIFTTSVSAKTVLKGDLNLDGRITAADARGTLRISAKLDKADDEQMIIADVTNDKKITASDARSILRAAAKLQESFGEIEIGGNNETETTTVADKETTTVSGPKTELSSLIGKESDSFIKEFDDMHKVGTSDGTLKYTNGKVTLVSDPSIIKDKKISSITVFDAKYLLNGISVDMTPEKATDILKKADWIVNAQNSTEIILSKNLMKMVISVSDGVITKIEYAFAESLLSPEETTTKEPVTEESATKEEPEEDEPTTEAPTTEEPTTEAPTTEHIHSYSFVVIPPSCEKDGCTRFTCSGCSDTYDTDIVKSTGHSPVWVCVTPAQIGKEGLEQFKCKICSTVIAEEKIPALKAEEQEKPEGDLTVEELPSQIKSFLNGNFGIEGYNYSGEEKSPISMYVSPDHVKAGMSLNNMAIDMLIRDANTKNPSVYLVRPDVKKYAKLTSIDMSILGIKVDDLKLDFSSGMSTPDSIMFSTQNISGEKYDIYTIYAGSEYCKIYMIGEDIKRIETYETETKMFKSRIDVTTFVAEPGDNAFSVDGYKKALSYMFLFDLG